VKCENRKLSKCGVIMAISNRIGSFFFVVSAANAIGAAREGDG
jgi:hypothetical protein